MTKTTDHKEDNTTIGNATNNTNNPKMPAILPLSETIKQATEAYLANSPGGQPELYQAAGALEAINSLLEMNNSVLPKNRQQKLLNDIPLYAVAVLIANRKDVALLGPGDKSGTGKKAALTREEELKLPIVHYQTSGSNKGIWEIMSDPTGAFGCLVERYRPGTKRAEKKEILTNTKALLRIIQRCVLPHYVPVNNGIFDMKNKQLLPFSPDLVFTSKIHTDLNLKAANPFIPISEDGSIWDVDSWLASLGSPEFVDSIKEVIQAACLPLAPRNKMALFYSKAGNNGKGTVCQLIRNLLGEEVVANIPLKDFSTKFRGSDLATAMAVVVDENAVNSFNTDLSTLKAAITGDKITIEQKYHDPYSYNFRGLILECINAIPKVDDKTGSFQRRLHFILFPNSFTGREKRYIKQELIYRSDVLEYILKMVLVDMDYREQFTETQDSKELLKTFDVLSNSVVSFLDEFLPQCQWDLLPGSDFLYEAYKVWYKRMSPSGKVIGRNEFLDEMRDYVQTNPDPAFEWEWTESTRSQGYITKPEPLLSEYELRHFQNVQYLFSYDTEKRDTPCNLKTKYSGLKRKTAAMAAAVAPMSDEDGKGGAEDE